MTNLPQDWIVAAACRAGTPPGVRFADMPREHRRQMLIGILAAALSIASVVMLGILLLA
jgi:hypothetical protein